MGLVQIPDLGAQFLGQHPAAHAAGQPARSPLANVRLRLPGVDAVNNAG
ncbi:MAG: hypothetical protein AABZ30_01820 [Myxococcota bacterium]